MYSSTTLSNQIINKIAAVAATQISLKSLNLVLEIVGIQQNEIQEIKKDVTIIKEMLKEQNLKYFSNAMRYLENAANSNTDNYKRESIKKAIDNFISAENSRIPEILKIQSVLLQGLCQKMLRENVYAKLSFERALNYTVDYQNFLQENINKIKKGQIDWHKVAHDYEDKVAPAATTGLVIGSILLGPAGWIAGLGLMGVFGGYVGTQMKAGSSIQEDQCLVQLQKIFKSVII